MHKCKCKDCGEEKDCPECCGEHMKEHEGMMHCEKCGHDMEKMKCDKCGGDMEHMEDDEEKKDDDEM